MLPGVLLGLTVLFPGPTGKLSQGTAIDYNKKTKVYLIELDNDRGYVRRFEYELKVLAELQILYLRRQWGGFDYDPSSSE